ncbi:MAG TPA: hypothetical protein VFE02_19945 [Candidatus Acidoferrales bacterium]|jgi:hypothetical protein|nr:hypothetical protein [Candidatus Acidoferrales bacterium]
MADGIGPGNIGLEEQRRSNSRIYPWYDSVWLSRYEEAKDIIRRVRPEMLSEFIDAFRVFHTRPDFKVKFLEQPFDAATFGEIKRVATSLQPTDLELHEARRFGRFIVHDRPYFSELQKLTVPWVSEIVGEQVEVSYNFLSLYTSKGVCAVHMDSPEAKWTLDLCIDQGAGWPIYFSDVQPWPDSVAETWKSDAWENNIRQERSLQFTPYTLQPGQAVIFSGSSQWHYRDPMPEANGKQFCTLLFLHFIPKGTRELVRSKNWQILFGIPELGELSEGKSA